MDRAGESELTRRVSHWLARFPSGVAATALFALMVMTFCDVILRSVLNSPIEAATELTRILMAITVFGALPVVSWRGGHIAVDLLDPWFGRRARRLRDGLMHLLCGVILVWPTWRCVGLAERARDYGDLTEYLRIPQFYIAYFIALATGITALVLVIRGALILVRPDQVARDHG